jgi:hypothetical protein
VDDNFITTQAYDLAAIADVVAGDLALATIQLIKTNLALDRNTAVADVLAAAADYTGFALGVITWLAPSIADDGSIECVGTVPEFRPTGTVIQNQIYGCAMLDSTGAVLYGVCSFASGPYPMQSALNSILLTVRYKISAQGLIVTIT